MSLFTKAPLILAKSDKTFNLSFFILNEVERARAL